MNADELVKAAREYRYAHELYVKAIERYEKAIERYEEAKDALAEAEKALQSQCAFYGKARQNMFHIASEGLDSEKI